jgi:hypothetical protein
MLGKKKNSCYGCMVGVSEDQEGGSRTEVSVHGEEDRGQDQRESKMTQCAHTEVRQPPAALPSLAQIFSWDII